MPATTSSASAIASGPRRMRAQRLAAHDLHRQVVQIAVGADVVNPDEIGTGGLAGDVHFAPQALQGTGRGAVGAEDLQRDVNVELTVVCQVDDGIAAAAENVADFVSAGDHRASLQTRKLIDVHDIRCHAFRCGRLIPHGFIE